MTSTTTCRRTMCDRKPSARARGYCEKHAYAEGIFRPLLPISKASHIVAELMEQGHSCRAIARACNTSRNVINNIKNERNNTIRQDMYDRLREARDNLTQDSSATRQVDAWPLARRLRALAAAGHTTAEIVAATGLNKGTITNLRADRNTHVKRETGQTIRAYYAAHEFDATRPTDPRYVSKDWPKPMDWNNIDDPHEKPATAPTYMELRSYIDVTPELQEQSQFLSDFYTSYHKAAHHIGTNNTTLRDIARGERDTIARMTAEAIAAHYDDVQVGAHAPILRAS